MGKIRIKTLGLEDVEEKQKKADARRRESKKTSLKEAEKTASAVIADVEPTAKEAKKLKKSEAKKAKESPVEVAVEVEEKTEKKSLSKKQKVRTVGKKYKAAQKAIDKDKSYPVSEAVTILKKVSYTRFDGSVELHINSKTVGLKGEVQLPHLTGKTVKVAILDEVILKNIEKGTIDFDVLIATPADMPKLVPLAKILGPKGLMPTPKRGTLSDKPEEAAKKFASGGLQWKTEAKFPLIHLTIGKVSHKDSDLSENVIAILKSVGSKNIAAAFLSSSMSPSVRLTVE